MVEALATQRPRKRSQMAFMFGARTAVRRIRMPVARASASKAAANLSSRPRIKMVFPNEEVAMFDQSGRIFSGGPPRLNRGAARRFESARNAHSYYPHNFRLSGVPEAPR